LEPIQPDYPWQHCLHGDALPDTKLLHAVIMQGWKDANSRHNTKFRTKARLWFYSYQFYQYCELLNLDFETFLNIVEPKWGRL